MSDLEACINRAIESGDMDAARGDQARQMFLELERSYNRRMGTGEARTKAAREAVARVRADAHIRARQKLLQLVTLDRIVTHLSNAADPETAARALIEDLGGSGLGLTSARGHHAYLRGQAHAKLHDAIRRFSRDLAGRTRNQATQMDVGREGFGERTGNATAKAMADAWGEVSEFLRNAYNAAGGAIGRLERWGLPTAHDWVRVREVGRDEWIRFITPLLDRQRMVDYATGAPLSDAELDRLLGDMYDTISTDGWDNREPSMAPAGRSLANRRGDSRHLHFRDFDAWQSYQTRFGNPDVFDTMISHIESLSRDTGAMRALGPNPRGTIRYVQQWLQGRAMRDPNRTGKDARRSESAGAFLDMLYSHYIGDVNRPVNEAPARFFASVRAGLTAAHLGSAAISAISDFGFGLTTARVNGFDLGRYLGRYVGMLSPANKEDRQLAIRFGLIAEEATQMGAAMARFTGDIQGNEFFRRASDFTMRASGLSQLTQVGKWAFGMEYLATLADHAGRAFKDLPEPLQRQFAAYGITPDDWNAIRATDLYEHKGVKFLRPDELAGRSDIDNGDALATKLMGLISQETEFAVPSVSLTGRAMFSRETRPGTVPGELIRSGLMYKNFAITLAFTHLARALWQDGIVNKARYLGSVIAMTTVLGALAMQFKEIAKGRDPREMDNGKFFIAAMAQGGGLGIFGDFLFAETNRFGRGFEQTIAGPVAGLANDLHKLSVGNVYDALEGRDPRLARDLIDFAGRYTPGGSIWYARALYERAVLDQLRNIFDPDASDRYRRQMQAAERNYGSGYWWAPGNALPGRAPDVTGALGG